MKFKVHGRDFDISAAPRTSERQNLISKVIDYCDKIPDETLLTVSEITSNLGLYSGQLSMFRVDLDHEINKRKITIARHQYFGNKKTIQAAKKQLIKDANAY